jgi:transposase
MKHKLVPHEDKVKEIIAKRPDITLEEIKEARAKEGIEVSPSAIDRYLSFLGISRKKNASSRRAAALRHSGIPGRMA